MSRANRVGLAVCLVLPLTVGMLGGLFTDAGPGSWYASLRKPGFTPPGWVFGPVWAVLYVLMGVAAFLVWRKGAAHRAVRSALVLFAVQLALNGLWSPAFFGLRSLAAGMVVIVLLWVVLVATVVRFWRVSAAAGELLLPYLFWVSFALVLNAFLWAMN